MRTARRPGGGCEYENSFSHFAAMDFVVKLITMLLLSSVLTPDYYYGRAEASAVADGVVKEDVNLDGSSSCATHDVRQKIMECVRSTL